MSLVCEDIHGSQAFNNSNKLCANQPTYQAQHNTSMTQRDHNMPPTALMNTSSATEAAQCPSSSSLNQQMTQTIL